MSEKMTKNFCIIQARMGSTRLPGKVLLEVDGVPLLEYLIKRVKLAKKIDKIVVATGSNQENDPIEKLCLKLKIDCFRGSEKDVLDRYYQCLKNYPEYQNIVRVTGDCPLIDPKVIDQVIDLFEQGNYDYASNVVSPTFPDGMDVEIFRREVLEESAKKATTDFEREHVNEYLLGSDKFTKGNLKAENNYSKYHLTVDNEEDYLVVKFLAQNSKIDASYLNYVELLEENPEIKKLNAHINRNEYAFKNKK